MFIEKTTGTLLLVNLASSQGYWHIIIIPINPASSCVTEQAMMTFWRMMMSLVGYMSGMYGLNPPCMCSLIIGLHVCSIIKVCVCVCVYVCVCVCVCVCGRERADIDMILYSG